MSLSLQQTHGAVRRFIWATQSGGISDRGAAVAAVAVTWLRTIPADDREIVFAQLMAAIIREAGFASGPRAHANDCEAS